MRGKADTNSVDQSLLGRLLTSLPLGLLYGICAFLIFVVFRILRIRVQVVRDNLTRSLPQFDAAGINRIMAQHYSATGQIIAEAIAAGSMAPAEIQRRVRFTSLDLPRSALATGKPLLIVGAHQCNWEWILHALALQLGHPLDVGYKPIRTAWAERMMFGIRTRFGSHLVPAKELLPDMIRRRKIVRAVAMLADQEPLSAEKRHWVKFLGRDTAFYLGPEEMARTMKYPAIFVGMRRVRRGSYEIDFQPLATPEEALQPGEFTQRYAQRVEAQILADPADWLWSHRRWKLKKTLYGSR
ncbi:MAG: lysophospholipid acyltransferase family protein [Steroidobacteraceae bacterium]